MDSTVFFRHPAGLLDGQNGALGAVGHVGFHEPGHDQFVLFFGWKGPIEGLHRYDDPAQGAGGQRVDLSDHIV